MDGRHIYNLEGLQLYANSNDIPTPPMLKQDYADQLEGQLRYSFDSAEAAIGRSLTPEELDMMNEQQLGQLLELKTETSKPRTRNT